jgi:DnaJ-class molecular chaperone
MTPNELRNMSLDELQQLHDAVNLAMLGKTSVEAHFVTKLKNDGKLVAVVCPDCHGEGQDLPCDECDNGTVYAIPYEHRELLTGQLIFRLNTAYVPTIYTR